MTTRPETPPPGRTRPFLAAEWRHLAMANWEVEPGVVAPFVPAGTELDRFEGRTFVSVVGFLFLGTRFFGVPAPFHQRFVEVNLRIYVRRRVDGEWRRGVVFVKELVGRRAVAWIARRCYGENYDVAGMGYAAAEEDGRFAYTWSGPGRGGSLELVCEGEPLEGMAAAEARFITEHYWGYSAQPDGGTLEYEVAHPRWRVFPAREVRFECDVAAVYGAGFVQSLEGRPSSAFVADGSQVVVHRGRRMAAPAGDVTAASPARPRGTSTRQPVPR